MRTPRTSPPATNTYQSGAPDSDIDARRTGAIDGRTGIHPSH